MNFMIREELAIVMDCLIIGEYRVGWEEPKVKKTTGEPPIGLRKRDSLNSAESAASSLEACGDVYQMSGQTITVVSNVI